MLHILWLILKIILIVLAVLLGLVLLIVLLVLFAPIRYSVAAEFEEDVNVAAKVRFLIVSFKVLFEKKGEENNLDTAIRICGIRINRDKSDTGGKDKKKKVKKEKKKKEKTDELSEDGDTDTTEIDKIKDSETDTEYSYDISEKSDNEVKEDSLKNLENTDDTDIDEYDLFDEEDDKKDKKKLLDRIKQFFEKNKEKSEDEVKESILTKLEEKSEAIKKKYEELEKKYKRFERFWNLQCTVKTREYIGRYLISIFRHIAPKKIKGRIRYGMDEPYKTGTVTGYLSLMPFVYQKHLYLEPDFYEKVIEGNVELKGRIVLGYIARIALKPYIWQTIKAAKRLKN